MNCLLIKGEETIELNELIIIKVTMLNLETPPQLWIRAGGGRYSVKQGRMKETTALPE